MPNELKKRVQILDGMHDEIGKKMIEWTLKPNTRPQTIEDLEKQFRNLAKLSPELKDVMFIDTPPSIALFRLPPKNMVLASLARAEDEDFKITDYKLPGYYGDIDFEERGIDALTLFRSRIGDYTTGECE